MGQNLGAGQPDRAARSVWLTARINTVILSLIGLIFILFTGTFIRMFISDPAVILPGIEALRIISIGFLFYGLGMVMIQSFNGAGDTVTPTKAFFVCFWLIEIPLALILSKYTAMGQTGVFLSIVIAETCMTVLALVLFRQGKWKLKKSSHRLRPCYFGTAVSIMTRPVSTSMIFAEKAISTLLSA